MVDPEHGVPFFLLGRNRCSYRWKQGSRRLSFFGGRNRPRESEEDCAAREFYEETLGSVLASESDSTRTRHRERVSALSAQLKRGEYLARMTTPRGPLFVLNIPWDPTCAVRFRSNWLLISALNKLCRQKPSNPSAARLTSAEREAFFGASPAQRAPRHRWLLCHPAVSYTRVEGSKPRVDRVRPQFLEKEAVVLASARMLHGAVAQEGRMLNTAGTLEIVQPDVIPDLGRVLSNLKFAFP